MPVELRHYERADLRELEFKQKSGYFAKKAAEWRAEKIVEFPRKKETKSTINVSQKTWEKRRFVRLSRVQKLILVRERKERYVESKGIREDLLRMLKSGKSPTSYIRKSELKGMSFWFHKDVDEYLPELSSRYTPVRPYYANMDKSNLEPVNTNTGMRALEFAQ